MGTFKEKVFLLFLILALTSFQFKFSEFFIGLPDWAFITTGVVALWGAFRLFHGLFTRSFCLENADFIFLVLFVVMIYSAHTQDSRDSLQKIMVFGYYVLPIYFCGRFLAPSSDDRRVYFYKMYICVAAIAAVFSVSSLIQKQNLNIVLGTNYLTLGQTLGIGALLSASLVRIKQWHPIGMIFTSLCAAIMILSPARGPLLALVVAGGLYTIRNIKYFEFKQLCFFGSGFFLVVIMGWGLMSNLSESSLGRMGLAFQPGGEASMNERFDLWRSSLFLIADHVWSGIGIGQWSHYINSTAAGQHPHNIFLEFFVELGLFGFLLGSGLLALMGYKAVRNMQQAPSDPIPYVWIFLFINALKSGDMIDNWLLFFFGGWLLRRSKKCSTKVLLHEP